MSHPIIVPATWWHPERVARRGKAASEPTITRRARLVEMVEACLSDREIAARLGAISYRSITRWRKRLGLEKPEDAKRLSCLVINDATCARLAAWQAEGLSRQAVAQRTGLPVETVRRLYRRAAAYQRRHEGEQAA